MKNKELHKHKLKNARLFLKGLKICRRKSCLMAGTPQPLSAFPKNDGKTGLRCNCRRCATDIQMEYARKNPKRIKNSELKSTYGITIEDFDALLTKQHYACAICKRISNKTLHVDHNHTTGKVRGLLCAKCNTALGLISEDILILESMQEYIRGSR